MIKEDVANIPEDQKKKIKDAVREMAEALGRINDERELIKSILEENEDTGVEKKVLRRAARTLFKASFVEERDANAYFEEMFSSVILKV